MFLWALATRWRPRDALSLDVALVLSAIAALFALGLVRQFVGPLPPIVSGIAAPLLLGQPALTAARAST